ncbi:MAG: PKD domain-containing protein [Candidatus Eisenbacteria bacterium]|uniref:PKD domain-containing protein n=1 Tax=Eiseniibacteriota bacterium TaxID=2212470 RepID=A0A538TM16_UNCEI|nr:MAG: PKD domain-containing protein [Candidatus Eisenbacteria bacterium]
MRLRPLSSVLPVVLSAVFFAALAPSKAQAISVQLSERPALRAATVSAISLNAPDSTSGLESEFVSITATAGSGDPHSIITIGASGFPPGLSFTTNTPTGINPSATISGTLQPGTAGTWFIEWHASDQFGATDSTFTRLTVTSPNNAPILSQPNNMTVPEGTVANQTLLATDADGDPLFFSSSSAPSFVSVTTVDPDSGTATGNVHVAPTFNDAGSYFVEIDVTDGVYSDSRFIFLSVPDVPEPPAPGQPVWERLADMQDPRTGSGVEGAAASLIGNKIYVSHGYRYSDTAYLSIYDIPSGTWTHGGTTAPTARVPRSEMAGGQAFGKHYAIGGRTGPNAEVEEFDPVAQTWTTRAPMSLARGGVGAASWGNKIYAVGGRSGASYGGGLIYSMNEVYDPTVDRWTTLAPMPVAVSDNYATVAYAGKVYVFGGTDGFSHRSDVQIYNIATNAWSMGARMPTARGAAMAGVIGDKIAVFGGYNGGNLRVTELYDPSANSWTTGPEMPFAVSEISQGVTFDGRGIYAIGSGIFGISSSIVLALRPVISMDAPAAVSVDEGQSLTFAVSAAHRNGLAVALGATGLPAGATFRDNGDNTGTFTWTPNFMSAGAYTVTFRADDGHGATNSTTTVITVRNVNRPPRSNPGGPYTAFVATPMTFDGSGSSDPDGDALAYQWTFGDGTTGIGASPAHTYAAIGPYGVALLVSDGAVSDLATTTVSVVGQFLARAFTAGGNPSIRLNSGKQTWCAQVEPTGYAFNLTLVDPATLVMKSPGTGSVGQISALTDKSLAFGDNDHNGVEDMAACFGKNDLRLLFSNINGTRSVPVSIEGMLFGGGIFRAALDVRVIASGHAVAALVSPNPLNPTATLTFTTLEAGYARVRVYDAVGRLTRTLLDEALVPAGYHDLQIDGLDGSGARLATGIYFYQVETAFGSTSGRFTVLK